MRAHHCLFAPAALLALGWLACQAPPPAPEPPGLPPRVEDFSSQRAWAHLRALTDIGPRVMGSEGAARAREYIRGELTRLGLEVRDQRLAAQLPDGELLEVVNVAGIVPGASSDVIMFAAPYDTRGFESFRFVGANDGGSGAAVLLELAEVIAADPLPYTSWFVFLDGEAPPPGAPADMDVAPAQVGSKGLAARLVEKDALNSIRLIVVINRVGDPDLRIARDLMSHRVYREEFWRAAVRRTASHAFPPAADFESPQGSHRAFAAAGLRQVVAVIDTSFGGDEPPGVYANTEDDDLRHCSPQSLETAAHVTLDAVEAIAKRLERIDRFAESPKREPIEPPTEGPGYEEVEPEGAAEESPAGATEEPKGAVEKASETPAGALEEAPEPPAGTLEEAPEPPEGALEEPEGAAEEPEDAP